MNSSIKEFRRNTGMTQQEFADAYDIPVSTLRKWEQGESSPPSYVIKLIAKTIPADESTLKAIHGRDGKDYYYNSPEETIIDGMGNKISIKEELAGVKEENLSLYVADLFQSFYEIQDKFNRDCKYDKEEDIIWL